MPQTVTQTPSLNYNYAPVTQTPSLNYNYAPVSLAPCRTNATLHTTCVRIMDV